MSKSRFKVFEKPPIEESYDYAEQVRRQIERCLEASAIQEKDIREKTFAATVLALDNLVPFEDRDEEFENDLKTCTGIEEQWTYRTRGVRKLGTPENPLIHYDKDGNESSRSPTKNEVPTTNWDRYFRVVFNKFVSLKVTVRRGTYSG